MPRPYARQGALFAPVAEPTVYAIPGHVVIHKGSLVLDSGWLFDAREQFGDTFAGDAADAIVENAGGVYGFRMVWDPEPGKHGVALFQSRYAWWDEPDMAVLRASALDLAAWMEANPRYHVRLGCPAVPRIPVDAVMRILGNALPAHVQPRLAVFYRPTRPTMSDFHTHCVNKHFAFERSLDRFLWRDEGVES